jgi:hypothetical protein
LAGDSTITSVRSFAPPSAAARRDEIAAADAAGELFETTRVDERAAENALPRSRLADARAAVDLERGGCRGRAPSSARADAPDANERHRGAETDAPVGKKEDARWSGRGVATTRREARSRRRPERIATEEDENPAPRSPPTREPAAPSPANDALARAPTTRMHERTRDATRPAGGRDVSCGAQSACDEASVQFNLTPNSLPACVVD